MKQAGIAIAEEAVVRGDGVGVSRSHAVEPSESGDQHEERRARQMEVGEQDIDRAEAIARRDEQRGLAGERADMTLLVGSTLEEAQRRRTDGDDAAAFSARGVDAL